MSILSPWPGTPDTLAQKHYERIMDLLERRESGYLGNHIGWSRPKNKKIEYGLTVGEIEMDSYTMNELADRAIKCAAEARSIAFTREEIFGMAESMAHGHIYPIGDG